MVLLLTIPAKKLFTQRRESSTNQISFLWLELQWLSSITKLILYFNFIVLMEGSLMVLEEHFRIKINFSLTVPYVKIKKHFKRIPSDRRVSWIKIMPILNRKDMNFWRVTLTALEDKRFFEIVRMVKQLRIRINEQLHCFPEKVTDEVRM